MYRLASYLLMFLSMCSLGGCGALEQPTTGKKADFNISPSALTPEGGVVLGKRQVLPEDFAAPELAAGAILYKLNSDADNRWRFDPLEIKTSDIRTEKLALEVHNGLATRTATLKAGLSLGADASFFSSDTDTYELVITDTRLIRAPAYHQAKDLIQEWIEENKHLDIAEASYVFNLRETSFSYRSLRSVNTGAQVTGPVFNTENGFMWSNTKITTRFLYSFDDKPLPIGSKFLENAREAFQYMVHNQYVSIQYRDQIISTAPDNPMQTAINEEHLRDLLLTQQSVYEENSLPTVLFKNANTNAMDQLRIDYYLAQIIDRDQDFLLATSRDYLPKNLSRSEIVFELQDLDKD